MPLCIKLIHIISKSLLKHAKKMSILLRKEVPLCSCKFRKRASFTVEAAIIIPLVVGFLATLLMFFRIMETETEVCRALSLASRKTAVLSEEQVCIAKEYGIASTSFWYALSEDSTADKFIDGGISGISLLESVFDENYVDLVATYRIKLPVQFFRVDAIWINQRSKSRKWNGIALKQNTEDDCLVYITPTGSVYHLSMDCNYLDLSIRETNYASINSLRNANGHIYYPCEQCVKNNTTPASVYVTNYGTAYHADIGCSGLKRTVKVVRLSEVGNRRLCSKCAYHTSEDK